MGESIVLITTNFPNLSLYHRLADLDIENLSLVNLGAGSPTTAFTSQVASLPLSYLIQVEIFLPYALRLMEEVSYQSRNVVIEPIDIRDWVKARADKSIDVALMLDVLEHLNRTDAIALLEELKRIVRKRILIWIPLGYCRQEEYDGNSFQRHLSTWYPEDFEEYQLELFPQFHKHIVPPCDAGWVTIEV